MCDIQSYGRIGWRGWPMRGEPREFSPIGHWTDLSHQLHNDIPVPHFFPRPKFGRVMAMPTHRLNVTHIEMVCHAGTHVDAPSHFFMDAPDFHAIPFDRLHGLAVVWKVDVEPFGLITADHLAAMRPSLNHGDMLLLNTGWSKFWGTDAYWENPSLSQDAADWLVSQRVTLVGVDFISPDMALPRRDKDFDWPVHKTLLSRGTLIAENIDNLQALAGQRVELLCLALNIYGADGSPARIAARAVELIDQD